MLGKVFTRGRTVTFSIGMIVGAAGMWLFVEMYGADQVEVRERVGAADYSSAVNNAVCRELGAIGEDCQQSKWFSLLVGLVKARHDNEVRHCLDRSETPHLSIVWNGDAVPETSLKCEK